MGLFLFGLVICVASMSVGDGQYYTENAVDWPSFMKGTGFHITYLMDGGLQCHDFDLDGFPDIFIAGSLSSCSQTVQNDAAMFYGGTGGQRYILTMDRDALPPLIVEELPGYPSGSTHALRINADGFLDIFLYSSVDRWSKFLLNRGPERRFEDVSKTVLQGIAAPTYVAAVGDINDDGLDDMFHGFFNQPKLYVMRDNMTLANADALLLSTPAQSSGVPLAAIEDLTGDSKYDIFALPGGLASVLYVQLSNGSFELQLFDVPDIFTLPTFAVADFDNDGALDMVIGGNTSSTSPDALALYLVGLGNGSFVRIADAFANNSMSTYSLSVGDYDMDGTMDVARSYGASDPVVGSGNSTEMRIFYGSGRPDSTNFNATLELPPPIRTTVVGDGRAFFMTGFDVVSFVGSSGLFYLQIQKTYTDTWATKLLGADRTVRDFPFDSLAAESPFCGLTYSMMHLADLIDDNCTDLVVCGRSATEAIGCEILRGACDGSFSESTDGIIPIGLSGGRFFNLSAQPYEGSILTDDWDNDGVTDLLVYGSSDFDLTTPGLYLRLSSKGSANQYATSGISTTRPGAVMTSVDWTGDGIPDLVSVYGPEQTYSFIFWENIYNGTGDVFRKLSTTKGEYPVWPSWVSDSNLVPDIGYWGAFAFGDLFGNGRADFLYRGDYNNPKGGLYRNTGNLSYEYVAGPRELVGRPCFKPRTVITDLDGDGHGDVVMVGEDFRISFCAPETIIAFGNSTGGFVIVPRAEIPLPTNQSFFPNVDIEVLWPGAVAVVSDGNDAFYTTISNVLLCDRNRSLSVIPISPEPDMSRPVVSAGLIDSDNITDFVIGGSLRSFCQPPYVYTSMSPVVSTSTSTGEGGGDTGGGTNSNDSSNDDSSIGAIIGGVIGGGAALFGLLGLAALCCSVCLCVAVILLCVCFIMVVAAVVVVVAVVLAGGGAALGGGGGLIALLRRRKPRDDEWIEMEPAEDMDEVMRRMQETNTYRQIDWDEMEFGKKIGEGAYGQVYVGAWQGAKVAFKTVGMESAAAVEETEREAVLMSKVSHHPNMVQFIGMATKSDRIAMVLRFCDGGSLDSALSEGRFDAAGKCRVLSEVAGALDFLHAMGVVHRDIAARNILLDGAGTAKLADLGLSRVLEDDAVEQSTKSSVGPVRWMAPEALSGRKYSGASDAWSFGVLMWEVWSDGATPYGGFSSVADVAVAVVREGKRLIPPQQAPAAHVELMKELFATEPADRPQMSEVYSVIVSEQPKADDIEIDSGYEYEAI